MIPEQLEKELKRLKKMICCSATEILESEDIVAGNPAGHYRLGYIPSSGQIFYVDPSGNWQPIPGGSGGGDLQHTLDAGNTANDQSITLTNSDNSSIAGLGFEHGLGSLILSNDGFTTHLLADNATANHDIELPDAGGTLVASVNGILADAQGNVDVSGGLIEKTIQQIHALVDNYDNSESELYHIGLNPGAFYKISGVHSGNGDYNSFPALYNDGATLDTFSTAISNQGSYSPDGVYTNVPVTGGSGTGGIVTVTISGGVPTDVVFTNNGSGYITGDSLNIDNSVVGDGLGAGLKFNITITSIFKGTTIILQALTPTTLSINGQGEFFNPKYDQGVDGFGIWSNRSTWTATLTSGTFNIGEAFTTDTGITGVLFGTLETNLFIADDPSQPSWTTAVSITGNVTGATADISSVTVKIYSPSDIAVWGGYAWTAQLPEWAGDSIDVFTLNPDWIKLPYDETNYNKVWDMIQYDYLNDIIIYREDKIGNRVRTSNKNMIDNGFLPGTPINVFQWGNVLVADYIGVGGNILEYSYVQTINFQGIAFTDNEYFDSIETDNSYIGSYTSGSNSYTSTYTTANIFIDGTNSTNVFIGGGGIINQVWIGKSFQGRYIESNTAIGIDTSAATYLFNNLPITIFSRPDNTIQLRFFNNSNTIEFHNLTD